MWILAVALITMTSPISCSKKSIVQRRIEEIDIWRDKYQNDAYLENYLTENFEQNQLKKFVYIPDFQVMFIKSDDNTGNAQNNIQNPKPLDHSSKDVGLSTFKIWILIIFSFLAISIIGIAITLLILWIKGNMKQDNKIKHREYSRVLAEELRKENIDISRVRRALRDLIDTNDENDKFDTDLSEEEKKEYKEESANVIIKTMTCTNERSNNNNLDIICSKNNVYLNQGRTLFYKYVVKHIEEFENISSNEDLSEDEKDREIEVLMKEKLNDFLDNISKVFISINSKQDEIIKSFKDKLENGDPLVITGKLWISEYLRLFEVCNAAILTDLYYAVVNTKEEPIFFKNANFNKSSNGLRRRIEILAYYCSCLCYLTSYYGKIRDKEVTLFRGVGFRTDTEYKLNKNYRFITFQTCSTNINIAARYLEGEDNAFYTIHLPKNCQNGFYIREKSNSKNEEPIEGQNYEYLINPYTSFTLRKISDKYENINKKDILLQTQKALNDSKCYEMTLNNELFYHDNVLVEYFERHESIKMHQNK